MRMRAMPCKANLLSVAIALILTVSCSRAIAQTGETITNGSNTTAPFAPAGTVVNGFLFEPEVPLSSLKEVPTWNEIEQLLDNPYAVALCSSVGTGLAANTPGTEQGWPSYCSTSSVTRRPSLGGVTLPPLLVSPLNYNPTTGEYMRLLNPAYRGGTFPIPAELVQLPNTTIYYEKYKNVSVSAGNSRIEPGENEIDYNSPITADFSPLVPLPILVTLSNSTTRLSKLALIALETCISQTEAAPPEGSTLCGGET